MRKPITPNWKSGPLPLQKGETRFVMLNDIHVPDNIPLGPLFQFIEDFKPHHTLLVGDILEMGWASHWERQTLRGRLSLSRPHEEYGLANDRFFDPLHKATGSSEITFFEGNHEVWARKVIDENPDGEGFLEVWNNVNHVDRWVPNKSMASLGKLAFLHGDILGGNSKTCADRMLNLYRRSVRFGHFHSYNEASYTSPVDIKDRHTSRCGGTLKKFDEGFMKHRPHAWIHGFSYGWVYPNGTFDDYFVRINNGMFRAEGKRYR